MATFFLLSVLLTSTWHYCSTSETISISNNETEWFLSQPEFEDFIESEPSDLGRSLFASHPECDGRFLTLNPGDDAIIKSHNSYGRTPYPDDYLCRWLLLPNNCELSLVCSMGTRKSEARTGSVTPELNRQVCLDGDFFRLMGYKGAMDAVYCGDERLSLKVGSNKTLAMIFQTKPRVESPFGEEMRHGLLDLLGFNCNVMCQGTEGTSTPSTTLKPETPNSSTSPSTDVTNDFVIVEAAQKLKNVEKNHTRSGNCMCGELREARIICPFGQDCTTKVGSIPWQAGLVHRGSWQPWCGASLISDSYLLTAGHCVQNKPTHKIEVILADFDWSTRTDPTNEVRREIDHILKHPNFGKRANFDYDYALIKIRNPIEFDNYPSLRPVCLPELEKSDEDLDGLAGTASGWGITDPEKKNAQAIKLQRVVVRVISKQDCVDLYEATSNVTDTMMCASGFVDTVPEVGGIADACYGDSGGPFTIRQQGRDVLEGVISWGRSCGKPQWPGVYAKVGRVLSWILENTQDSTFCEPDLN